MNLVGHTRFEIGRGMSAKLLRYAAMLFFFVIVARGAFAQIVLPPAGDINTIAGNGTYGYSGDGGAAISAEIWYPSGVAIDSSGNVYIADQDNYRIRKVTASTGIISTIAGNGTYGYSGDGGAATSAELKVPSGVAVDSSGNVYIADSYNFRIRKVTASTGIISTIAGNGTGGYSGDGGAATSAEVEPVGVAVDSSGNVYIVDQFNQRIRKVTASTGIISTIAGNGTRGYSGDGGAATSAELNYPSGVGIDSSGNVYIADTQNDRIRKVTASTGIISTLAGNGTAGNSGDGGAATSGELNYPSGVGVDSSGNVYIADSGNERIRKVTTSTGIISTIAGNGTGGYSGDSGAATSAELANPAGVTIDSSGDVYIADATNMRVRAVGGAGRTPVTPTISLATSGTPSVYGAPVTFTATVTSGDANTITFYNGSSSLGTVTPNNGTAALTITGLSVGSYSIKATIAAGGNYAANTSSTLTQVVNQATPTITLVSLPNPSTYGTSVTFTATVTSGDANIVTFYNGSTSLGTATPSNGTATLTTSALSVGLSSIKASIVAGGNYAAATSNVITQTVNTLWDTGTVKLTVGGTTVATVNYGQGSTPSSIAEALAGSYSTVNVAAVNDTLYIEATGTGAASDYSYSVSAQSNDGFSPSSFQGGSGSLTSGANASSSPQTIYSFCIASSPSANCPSQPSGGYDGAGNILSYYDSVSGTWSMTTASGGSGYDTLNRLLAAQASTGPYQGLQAAWSYDSFGNRTGQGFSLGKNANVTAPVPVSTVITPAVNNRIQSVQGAFSYAPSYDVAGDVTADPGSGNQYLYDGEGRICAVSGPSGTIGYAYDAEGNRIAKGTITRWSCDPSVNGLMTAGNETDYVLGAGGEQVTELAQDANGSMNWQRTYVYGGSALIATYGPSPDTPNQPLPSFRFTDWLGTQRATTDAYGVAQGTCLGLPYGDVMSCSNPPDPHYFTGKERDAESGNDYFGARYYNSSMGRFISPDHLFVDQHPEDPQSWNLYAYVRNNPLVMLDPNGLGCLFDMGSAGNGQWNIGISNSISSDDCAGQHGTWVPGDINANDVGIYRSSDGNPMFQVTTNTGGNVYYSTFASGAQADEDGTCLNGCQGASIAHAPTDWLQSQIAGGSIDGLMSFAANRMQPRGGGDLMALFAGPGFSLNAPDNWAGPGGMGTPQGQGDWAAMAHDYNFFTNNITIGTYFNPFVSRATAKALIQSDNYLIGHAGGAQAVKMGVFFGVVNAFQWLTHPF